MDPKEIQFIKKYNIMMRQHGKAVVTWLFRKGVDSGRYPKEYLIYLKKKKSLRSKERIQFNNNYKIKNQVYQRDNWKCVQCKGNRNLCVDHIKPIETHPELNLVLENLQLLCKKCHRNKHKKTPEGVSM